MSWSEIERTQATTDSITSNFIPQYSGIPVQAGALIPLITQCLWHGWSKIRRRLMNECGKRVVERHSEAMEIKTMTADLPCRALICDSHWLKQPQVMELREPPHVRRQGTLGEGQVRAGSPTATDRSKITHEIRSTMAIGRGSWPLRCRQLDFGSRSAASTDESDTKLKKEQV